MHNAPTVSVVIATYNRAWLIHQAIASVLSQSFQDFEIIVVDDGSPDMTKDAVASIPDERIRYIRHERNKGLPAGRNTGIRAAKGSYIAFLDDDDSWRKDKLAKQVEYIQRYDAVLCAAETTKGPITYYRKPIVELSDLRRGNQFPPSGLMVRQAVIKELLFDEQLRVGEDWDAYIRIAQRYSIGFDREPLILYNDGEHDRMTNKAFNLPIEVIEKRMLMLRKNKDILSPFWFNYHVARTLLAYFNHRSNKLYQLKYTMKRCGFAPTALAMMEKVKRRTRRLSTLIRIR